MKKEELSVAERKRISALGGRARARKLTQAERTAQAQRAARARYEKVRLAATA
jgi:hypothetical protein